MRSYTFVFVFLLLASPCFSFASTTSNFVVTSGTDVSTGSASVFPTGDIVKLSASDDSRIQSNSAWPTTGAYDENKYLEFVFIPNIPLDAVIESVSISHEFRRSGALSEAKLEIWDGISFIDQALTTGTANVDHTDTLDIFSTINTPEKLNNLKARFLAFRTGTASTTTSHDFIGLSVTYSIPVTLSSITITNPATKLSYTVGETLDITGLILTGTYSDNSTQTETITSSDVSGFDSSVPIAGQILTVTFGGKTTTYTVDIVSAPILDTTSPIITLVGNTNIEIFVGGVYTDAGATATDDTDSVVNVVVSGSVDTNVAGTYMIIYTATDTALNVATATRSVVVQAQTNTTSSGSFARVQIPVVTPTQIVEKVPEPVVVPVNKKTIVVQTKQPQVNKKVVTTQKKVDEKIISTIQTPEVAGINLGASAGSTGTGSRIWSSVKSFFRWIFN